MMPPRMQILRWAEWAFAAGLLALYVAASRHYFDFTDEAIHLYLINEWREASSPAPYFIFFGWFSALLPFDTVFGMRLLSPAMLFATSLYTSFGLGHYLKSIDPNPSQKAPWSYGIVYWPYMAIGSFFYFSLVSSISYDTLSAMGGYMWAGSLLWFLSRTPQSKDLPWGAIIGNSIALFMAAYSRPSFGVLLFLANIACGIVIHYALGTRALRVILIASAIFLGTYALSIALNWDIIERVISLYPSHAATSHHGVVKKAFTDMAAVLLRFVPISAVICFALLIIEKKYDRKVFALALGILAAVLICLAIRPFFNKAGYDLAIALAKLAILAPCIIVMWQTLKFSLVKNWHDHTAKQNIIIGFSCLGLAFICGIGTNSEILGNMVYLTPLMLLPVVLLMRGKPLLHFLFVALLTVMASAYLYKNIYSNYFRNAPLAQQTEKITGIPRLAHLSIEPQLANTLHNLKDALAKQNFDPEQDKILAWPDLPGFLSALDYRAFGNAWFYTLYTDMYKVNCAYIDLEPVGIVRDVYVVSDGSMDPDFKSCAFENLKPIPGRAIEVPLGSLMHYRNDKQVSLTLTGPYRFEKPDQQTRNGLQENHPGK